MGAASAVPSAPSRCGDRLPFEEVHFVGKDRFAIPEEGDDDSQAYRSFRRRVCNDEEGENLPVDVAKNARETRRD